MYLNIVLASAAFIFRLVEADDCMTPNNETAKCISLFDCPLLLKASSNAASRDFLDNSKCGTGFNVCCGTKPNFITDKPAKQNLTDDSRSEHANQLESNKNTIGSRADNNSKTISTKEEKMKLLPLDTCGFQHSDDYFHTVNYTVFTEFPWVAVVETQITNQFANTNIRLNSQTGTLINDKYVLTVVGHRMKVTGVWLGGYHPLNESQCLEDSRVYECNDPPQHFQIEETIRGDFVQSLYVAIGLLRLRGKVTYSDYIRPICLPFPGTRRPKIGDTLVESSSEKWKLDHSPSFGNGTKTRYYLKFYQNKCGDYFANYRDVVCLLYSETNVTSAPQGGPLMFSYRAKWYQEGIAVVRFSLNPTQGVYINVSYHLDWILDNLEP